MDIILIPGLWLHGSSWNAVIPALEGAGNRVRALTLPGMESKDADRSSITLADHVDAVVSAIENADGPVLLVGHSAGSGIGHAAVDARPDWADVGEEANVADFDEELLARFYDDAIPAPEQVLTTPLRLRDERRYVVPVTAVCPEYTAAELRGWVAAGEEPVSELARIRDVEYVDLPGGHWPQLTQPDKLARVILDAADKTRG